MRNALLLACVAIAAAALSAGEPTTTGPATRRAGPLASMPSTPGPHIDKIRALGDNQWLVLGPPAADPKWGVARGRSWGARQAYAPDLGGAFLCGSGIHGYVQPNGRYMDDLWFYDVNAHRWICLYPGADTKTLRLKLDAHRFEVNDRREHVPVSYLSHTYGNATYIPGLQKYTIIYTHCFWWTKALPQRHEWLEIPAEKRSVWAIGNVDVSARHPLFWDARSGKWLRRFVGGTEGPTRRSPARSSTGRPASSSTCPS